MKKVLVKRILLSFIMLIFLSTSNVFADRSKQSNEINFNKIKNKFENLKKNTNYHNMYNWNKKTVSTFGSRFTQDNKVIISGLFNDIEKDEVRDYGFFIGNDKDKLTNKISLKEEKKNSGFMEYEIKDFKDGKIYYYQAFIEYEDEITKGEVFWFHKGNKKEFDVEKFNKNLNQNKFNNWNNNWEVPIVSTYGNRFTQENTVIISGMFNNIENDKVCDYGFFIGNDKDNLTSKISLKEKKKHSGFMDYEIKNFEKGKTYYYQAYVEYEDEITKGAVSWFYKGTQEEFKVVTINALKGYEKNTILFIGKCENIKSMRSSKYGFYWGYSKEELSRKSYYDNQRDDYFIQSIKDVNEGTIYYQAFVENNGAIVKGELKRFEFANN